MTRCAYRLVHWIAETGSAGAEAVEHRHPGEFGVGGLMAQAAQVLRLVVVDLLQRQVVGGGRGPRYHADHGRWGDLEFTGLRHSVRLVVAAPITASAVTVKFWYWRPLLVLSCMLRVPMTLTAWPCLHFARAAA